MIRTGVIAALLALGLGLLYVRFAPVDAAARHVDPLLVERPGRPNHHLIRPAGGDATAPIYTRTPDALARQIDEIARADGAELIAGSVAAGHMTYLTRTRWLGFPDFTTIKVLPAGRGATFAAFARARFGQSDMGVNRARLERWMAELGDWGAAGG